MFRPILFFAVLLFSASSSCLNLVAQSVGSSHYGSGGAVKGAPSLSRLSIDEIQEVITVEGIAEVRVVPSEIRVVLAVTSEAPTAALCQEKCTETIKTIKAAWIGMGIDKDNIVVDFISVVPLYEWVFEKQGDRTVGRETRARYHMQTNLHVAVKNDAEASKAIDLAFQKGVTDIIAFDYWSKELDAIKIQARKKALQAARDKAEFMFGALFDKKPPAINVQEATVVHYPKSLYHSFKANEKQSVSSNSYYNRDKNIPLIHAHQPRNTYYRGLVLNSDTQCPRLPMQSEISVVSKVIVYYKSPAAQGNKNKGNRSGSMKNGFQAPQGGMF